MKRWVIAAVAVFGIILSGSSARADWQACNECLDSYACMWGGWVNGCSQCDEVCAQAGAPAVSQTILEETGAAVLGTVNAAGQVFVQIGNNVYTCTTQGDFNSCVQTAVLVGGVAVSVACPPVGIAIAGGVVIGSTVNCAVACADGGDPALCQSACGGALAVSGTVLVTTIASNGVTMGGPKPGTQVANIPPPASAPPGGPVIDLVFNPVTGVWELPVLPPPALPAPVPTLPPASTPLPGLPAPTPTVPPALPAPTPTVIPTPFPSTPPLLPGPTVPPVLPAPITPILPVVPPEVAVVLQNTQLTLPQVTQIQNVVNGVDQGIYVVGSQVTGNANAESDIDYIVPELGNWEVGPFDDVAPSAELPLIDWHGIMSGTPEPPYVYFEPGQPPVYVPPANP